MKNKFFSYLLIWTIFLASSVDGGFAQSFYKEKENQNGLEKTRPIDSNQFKKRLDLSISNVLDTPTNFDKIDLEGLKPLPKRKMSGKSKAMWIAIIAGSAVGLFFLIKYADPLECEIEAYCAPGEICQCLKYKDKVKK